MTHWKILRDPYLSELCRKHGEEAVFAAGFFMDEDPDDAPLDDVDWLCTPRPKLPISGARPAVLLSTGGFFPVHSGHLEMMERARSAARTAGFEVVAGYLSPGHDAYLRMKCGPDTPSPQQRLSQCAAAVQGSDWLSVDPWEALHRRVAVNFTDVTARLQAYLRRHVDARIEVLFVCGGDNARFASAFRERGHCIVVGRPGAEQELARWHSLLVDEPRLLWVAGDNPAASRTIRRLGPQSAVRTRLVVRLEDERAVSTLGLRGLPEFQARLLALLVQHADVRCVPLREPNDAPDVINLDAMHEARHQLAISRLYAVGGYEVLGHVPRPGWPTLAEQVAQIPAGTYLLRDDDLVTGSTLAAVRALLPTDVVIRGTELALQHAEDEDVVDARDFLLGADDAGLVLALPGGGVARAPYLLPYVDPAERASIAASQAFSIALWELNASTFAATALCVRDLPRAVRPLFQVPDDTALYSLCIWHAERLRSLTSR